VAKVLAQQFTGAAYWASYLVNGDSSGLSEREKHAADKWLESIAPYEPVDLERDGSGEVVDSHIGRLNFLYPEGEQFLQADLVEYECADMSAERTPK
jgi:hypothetical protein